MAAREAMQGKRFSQQRKPNWYEKASDSFGENGVD
jgi:hypothetical protein